MHIWPFAERTRCDTLEHRTSIIDHYLKRKRETTSVQMRKLMKERVLSSRSFPSDRQVMSVDLPKFIPREKETEEEDEEEEKYPNSIKSKFLDRCIAEIRYNIHHHKFVLEENLVVQLLMLLKAMVNNMYNRFHLNRAD